MAYDLGMAQLMREDLEGTPGLKEKRMFGGLAFLVNGHVVCGVHPRGAMVRVDKSRDAEARAIPGTGPMMFTGRPMSGWLDVAEATIADDTYRRRLVEMALACARALPPK